MINDKWYMINENKTEKKRSQRYHINSPRPTHGHKYTKYKMCLGIMMVIFIKKHLRYIWNSIHEKVKQHWGWVEKSIACKKSVYFESICYIVT